MRSAAAMAWGTQVIFPAQQQISIAWADLAQGGKQYLAVLDEVRIAPGMAIATASVPAWMNEGMWSVGMTWAPAEKEERSQERGFCGPAQARNLHGRPPPEQSDESRFSFPMPSEGRRASEKKTTMRRST